MKKNIISTLAENNELRVDSPIRVEGRRILKTADGYVYLYNEATKRAYRYEADGSNSTPITVNKFEAVVKSYELRMAEAKRVAAENQLRCMKTTAKKIVDTSEEEVLPEDDLLITTEQRWVGNKKPVYKWEPGSFITVRMKRNVQNEDGTYKKFADDYIEDGFYAFPLEEVRSHNGVAEPTGKEVTLYVKAEQDAVDSFKNGVNRRTDNWFWNQLNANVEHKWEYRKVTTIGLDSFILYLKKYPIKVLFDFTEWTDESGTHRTSKSPKVRLWFPSDRDETKNRQWHNTKATN